MTIDLKPDGAETILTLTHEQFFDAKARDDHGVGWNRALDNLEAFLISGKTPPDLVQAS